MTFEHFFKTATGAACYDYQSRLAQSPCRSQLISIPTGLGKTII
jgi:ERCC4-related helicase